MSNRSHDETDQPLIADDRNYYKVEKRTKAARNCIPEIIFLLWTIDIPFARV
jgi:hypothetical protein